MGFKTKLDYSSNRQIRQTEKTFTSLSGGTRFGLPFSGLTTGPDLSTIVATEDLGLFSGVTFTTIGGVTTIALPEPRLSVGLPYLQPFTNINSGVTQSTGDILIPIASTVIDGNTINTAFSGVTFETYVDEMIETSPGSFSGNAIFQQYYIISADTLDFKERLIWVDNPEITRTDRLIISRGAMPGYVLTSDSEGMGTWSPFSGGTGGGGNDYVNSGIFNTSDGDVTLTRLSGGTVSYNMDGRYSLLGHTHSIGDITDFTDNSTNWNTAYSESITGITVGGGTVKTITLFNRNGGTLSANFISSSGGGSGDVVTGSTFNTSDGILTLTTLSGDTITTPFDGRYSLLGHTHLIGDITDFTDNSTNWNTAYGYSQIGHLPLSGGTMLNTNLVSNLNADLLDSKDGLYYLDYNNFTNTPSIIVNTDDYVDSGVFNTSNGNVTLTRLSGGTVNYNLDGRWSLLGHTHLIGDITDFTDNSTNWNTAYDKSITGITVSSGQTKTITLNQNDGSVLQAIFDSGGELVKITEGGNTGYRIKDRNPNNYGDIGQDAIDFSVSNSTSTTRGATGERSVNFGLNNTTSKTNGFTVGSSNLNNGLNGIVGGKNNKLSADLSPYDFGGNIVLGEDNILQGAIWNSFIAAGSKNTVGRVGFTQLESVVYNSLILGRNNQIEAAKDGLYVGVGLKSRSAGVTILGVANEDISDAYASSHSSSIDGLKPRFIVGVGTVQYNNDTVLSRANGLVVMSDGTVSFPSLTNVKIDSSSGTSAVTKDWVNFNFSGGTGGGNDYVDSGVFNTSNGNVTLTRLSGGTVNYNLDGRYSLLGHTHLIGDITDFTDNSTNWNTAYDKSITGITVSSGQTKTITLNQNDGSVLQANFSDIGVNTYAALTDRVTVDLPTMNTPLNTALGLKENNLGNPSVNGQVLASTTTGVRSWVTLPTPGGTYTLPAATSSIRGGITVGSNLTIVGDKLSATNTTYLTNTASDLITGTDTVGKLQTSYNLNEWLSNKAVLLTGNQTVGGAKTFSIVPKSSQDASGSTDLIRKSQFDTGLATKENSLGNPSINGQVLSSTTTGVRSWITLPTGVTKYSELTDRVTVDLPTMNTPLNTALGLRELSLGNPSINGQVLASTTTGVRSWVSFPTGVTTYAALTDRVTVDLPTMNTPLNTALGLKENSLGNPSINGQVLVSTTTGVRSWVSLPTPITGSISIFLSGNEIQREELIGDVSAPRNSNTLTIGSNKVTTAKIATGAVTVNELASNSVSTIKVANSAITFAKIQNISTQTLLGRYSTGTGDVEQITLGSSLSLTTGGVLDISSSALYTGGVSIFLNGNEIQREALTGDVSAPRDSNTLTIGSGKVTNTKLGTNSVSTIKVANSAITFDKMQNIATQTLLGRYTTGTGDVQEVTLGSSLSLTTGGVLDISSSALYTGGVSIFLSGNEIQREELTGDVSAPRDSNTLTIGSNKVTTAKIATGAVTVNELASNAVSTIKVANSAVTFAKIQNITTQTLLGRYSTGTGDVQEVTLGSNLSLSVGGVLDLTNTSFYVGSTSIFLNGNEIQREALTGDVTASRNSNVLTIGSNKVTTAKIATGAVTVNELASNAVSTIKVANSAITFDKMQNITTQTLLGRYTTGTGDVQEVTLGSSLSLTTGGVLDISSSALYTGGASIFMNGNEIQREALTGDVTASRDSNVLTIGSGKVTNTKLGTDSVSTIKVANSAVTFAKIQNIATQTLLGRYTTGTGDVQEVTLGSSLSLTTGGVLDISSSALYTGGVSVYLSGNEFRRAALTGDVTAPANSNTLTIGSNKVTTAKIATGAVTFIKIQSINPQTLLGNANATGTGYVEEITLGANLTLDSVTKTLSANAGPTYTASTSIYFSGTQIRRAALTGDVTAPANSNTLTIGTGVVGTINLATNAVTTDKLDTGAVTTAKIGTGQVTASELASNSVTAIKIASSQVTNVKLATNSVSTIKVVDSAITFAKIQNISTQTLLGRYSTGTGDVQEVTLGPNITLSSGGVLDVSNAVIACPTQFDYPWTGKNSYMDIALPAPGVMSVDLNGIKLKRTEWSITGTTIRVQPEPAVHPMADDEDIISIVYCGYLPA